jgi:hypothetical protein
VFDPKSHKDLISNHLLETRAPLGGKHRNYRRYASQLETNYCGVDSGQGNGVVAGGSYLGVGGGGGG